LTTTVHTDKQLNEDFEMCTIGTQERDYSLKSSIMLTLFSAKRKVAFCTFNAANWQEKLQTIHSNGKDRTECFICDPAAAVIHLFQFRSANVAEAISLKQRREEPPMNTAYYI